MTGRQYEVAVEALARRREETLCQRSAADQERARHLHATMLWHLHQVALCHWDTPSPPPTPNLKPTITTSPTSVFCDHKPHETRCANNLNFDYQAQCRQEVETEPDSESSTNVNYEHCT